jgi:hypothetical protein
MASANREALARTNVEAAIANAGGTGWAIYIERASDGYLLRLPKGDLTFTRRHIDEAVLEDAWSPSRRILIEEARRTLEP